MVKRWAGPAYLFAVGMRDGATEATFTLAGMKGDDTLEVLDENRTIAATNGSFSDYFEPWAVHSLQVVAIFDNPPTVMEDW